MNSTNLESEWILTFADCGERMHLLGGKVRALTALADAGFPVPPFFVVTPAAFIASVGEEGMAALRGSRNYEDAARVLDAIEICPAVHRVLLTAAEQLCERSGRLLAVRSSALDEDGAEHSFAGQLESHLYVAPDNVAEKVIAVWKSAFAPRVWTYRQERALELSPQPPAVLVQQMVSADSSGVAFSADPVSGRRGISVVCAVRGMGAALVSGEVDADTFHVDRAGCIVKRDIRGHAIAPALDDEAVQAVARLARDSEKHFGVPQDIEWAIENGQLWLLQSRAITTLARQPDPDAPLQIWDNSNIAESYGGVTTPLTFSFVRRAYEEVYREFCRLMRVPKSRIHATDDVFSGMLGLIRGRIYYNLINWHRVLAMLPGYQLNRGFMEQMMGVREPLPQEALPMVHSGSFREKCWDLLHLARTVAGLLENHFSLPRLIRRFQRRLETALAKPAIALERMRPDELVAHYRELERQLLARWDAPLVNDFFAMIFHGVLRKLCEQWCGSPDGALANELIRDEGGIISAEPALLLRRLASLAANEPELVKLLQDGAPGSIRARLRQLPQMEAEIEEYLVKFGDRCLDELKLESATLRDNPTLLYRSIGRIALTEQVTQLRDVSQPAACCRAAAEEKVRIALGTRGWRAMLFGWVLRQARDRVRNRENLRFDRTKLFGWVRRVFVELGRRFEARGILENSRDVFYLELNEVLGVVEGTATTIDLLGLVRVRKAEFQRYRETPAPADRLTTRGPVAFTPEETLRGASPELTVDATGTPSVEERKGLGCCPGVVRGRVRVVSDPRDAVLQPGEILVAERTDPGWVILFPMVSGLLVERGSLLSHSAIVSRELGLPGIVSIPHLTSWLRTGDEVVMDGTTGVLKRLNPVQP